LFLRRKQLFPGGGEGGGRSERTRIDDWVRIFIQPEGGETIAGLKGGRMRKALK